MKLLAVLSLLIFSVNTHSEGEKLHHHGIVPKKSTEKRKSLSAEAKKNLMSIFEKNEALHSSFFSYDGASVEKTATKLANAIELIKDKKLLKILKRTPVQLKKMKASVEKDKNYHMYSVVNKTLVSILKEYDLGETYNVYSCPMLRKVWVQNSTKKDKVHNPYAGDYMPHCGKKDSNY